MVRPAHFDMWQRYKIHHALTAREELISRYAYLVRITAGRVVLNQPATLEWEDVLGAGIVGLIKAVDQFDLDREVKFETYGIALIRGHILEMLREHDFVPRSVRDRLKRVDRAMAELETRNGHPPDEFEIAEELGWTVERYLKTLSESARTTVVSLDEAMLGSDDSDGVPLSDALADPDSSVTSSLEVEADRVRLAEAIDCLPERERHVLSLYYLDRLTFKDVGQAMSVSESRAFQLHAQAIRRLRKDLKEDAVPRG